MDTRKAIDALKNSIQNGESACHLLKPLKDASRADIALLSEHNSRLLDNVRTLQYEIRKLRIVSKSDRTSLYDDLEKIRGAELSDQYLENIRRNLAFVFAGPPPPVGNDRQRLHRYRQEKSRCMEIQLLPPASLLLLCCLPPSTWKKANPAEFLAGIKSLRPPPDAWLEDHVAKLQRTVQHHPDANLQASENYQQFQQALGDSILRRQQVTMSYIPRFRLRITRHRI
jgi:hypothetical protein